jgi:hypothetical protein
MNKESTQQKTDENIEDEIIPRLVLGENVKESINWELVKTGKLSPNKFSDFYHQPSE